MTADPIAVAQAKLDNVLRVEIDSLKAEVASYHDAYEGEKLGRERETAVLRTRCDDLRAEVEHWKRQAQAAGVCMSCCGPSGPPEPYGCTDCLNTGWSGEYHNGMAAALLRSDDLQLELENERAKVAAAFRDGVKRAIAHVAGHSCEDEGCPHYGTRHAHPGDLETPADAQAALDKLLAEARLEGWRAGRDAAADEAQSSTHDPYVVRAIRALPEPKEASHD